MTKLNIIEGIGNAYEIKLKGAGITTLEGFLQVCAQKKGRAVIAERTGISEKLILKWANHADLARIKGIGGEYAELLEAAGVDTVPELAKRKPDNLYAKMVEVNVGKKYVRKIAALKQVDDWVQQAAVLPRVMEY